MEVQETFTNFVGKLDLTMEENIRLSPQELAELVNTCPEKFQKVDFGYHTDWNLDYLYDFFCCVKSDSRANWAQKWIVANWKAYNRVFDSYSNATDGDLVQKFHEFEDGIINVRNIVSLRRQEERELEELKRQSLEFDLHKTDTYSYNSLEEGYDGLPDVIMAIKALDINVQGILHITNDEDYAELVDICRNEIWPWLDKRRGEKRCRPIKDANVVRFAFRLWGIVDQDCSVANFVLLFNSMVPEAKLKNDTVSSREDANMKSRDFYKYDGLPNYNFLKMDTEQLRQMLKPVVEKLVG